MDSVNNFIDKKYKESFVKRNDFSQNIVESQEDFRKQYLEMIGQPPTFCMPAGTKRIGLLLNPVKNIGFAGIAFWLSKPTH